jgi:hypothetical protein
MIKFVRDEILVFVELDVLPRTSKAHSALEISADFVLRKTSRSLKAICDLCLANFGEDAQILGRTIFELSLTLAFITKPLEMKELTEISSDDLARLYILHGNEEQIRMQQRIEGIQSQNKCKDWNFNLTHENSAKGDYVRIHKDLLLLRDKLCNYLEKNNIKHSRERNWNYMTLEETAQFIGEPVECQYYYVYWVVSNLVHPSTLGSSSYYKETPGEVERGLILGFNCFWRVLTMTNQIFKLNLDQQIDEFGSKFAQLAKLD